MIVYGKNACKETIDSGATINKLLIQSNIKDEFSCSIVKLAKENNIKFMFVPKQTLDKLSDGGRHQGYILETTDFEYAEVEDIINTENNNAIVLLLDQIEDSHNAGAIVRSAECAGVNGIIIPKNRSFAVNEIVSKTSAGALAYMPIARVVNLKNAIETLKNAGYWIYALEADGDDIYKTNLKGKIALVVGSEGFGVSESIKKSCDGTLSLKMYGKINSLNASVATGIALFEVLRQRQ